MQTHDRVEVDQEEEKPRRGFLIGIAAAAAIVIGVLILFRPGGNAPVAAEPTAVEIATGFVEAYTAFDIDKAASYLTEPALAAFSGDLEGLRLQLSHLRAQGAKLMLDTCEAQNSSPSGTSVRCTYDYHGIRSDEIGLGPYSGSRFDITVLEGEIVSVSDRIEFMSNGFSSEMWEPFGRWVASTHPDDVAVMYTDSSRGMQQVTPESNALWEQRSREYAAVKLGSAEAASAATAFVEAYGSFDMDTAFSYLADDAVLPWPGDPQGVRLYNRLLQGIGFQVIFDACEEPAGVPSAITVRCRFQFHSLRSDEIGLGPYGGSWFDFTVRDGEIISASIKTEVGRFSPEMWEPFAAWVAENYPEDVGVMYTNSSQMLEALTDESIALWEQRSQEYVAAVGG